MGMRLNFIKGAKDGSTSRGQGNYQVGTVTLQLLKDLAFQKGKCPFAMERHSLPPGKDCPGPERLAWFTDQCSSTERLPCQRGRPRWAIVRESECPATEFTLPPHAHFI